MSHTPKSSPPKSSKVCFVFLSIFSVEGGIQSYVKDVLSAYADNKEVPQADIFLLRDTLVENSFIRHPNLNFICLGNRSIQISRLKLAYSFTKALLQKRYSKVVCGHIILTPLIYPLCQFFRVPLILMTYGKEVWNQVPRVQKRALQGVREIWTISRYTRDLACAAHQLDPQKFQMMPCVVQGHLFTPGSKNADLLARYGLQDSRVLMTVARLWSGDIYKGVDITIRALPDILKVFPNVKYLVIGRGDDQPRLEQLAQELGVRDRVVFAGYVAADALVEHYRLADGYVMPSREGFGIVYLEAMACGIPVIAGNEDGSADPLQDGKLGWRVPHRNPQAVAQACIELLKGEDPRCRGEWLRAETLAHFSPESLRHQIANRFLPQPSQPEES